MNELALNQALVDNCNVDKVENRSDTFMNRALVTFKNGHTLSIIHGYGSYGHSEGLFEVMSSEDDNEGPFGHLTIDEVNSFVERIGNLK